MNTYYHFQVSYYYYSDKVQQSNTIVTMKDNVDNVRNRLIRKKVKYEMVRANMYIVVSILLKNKPNWFESIRSSFCDHVELENMYGIRIKQ